MSGTVFTDIFPWMFRVLELKPQTFSLSLHLFISHRVLGEVRTLELPVSFSGSSLASLLLLSQCLLEAFIISSPFSLLQSKFRCLGCYSQSPLLTEWQGYKAECTGDSLWLIDINPPSFLPSIVWAYSLYLLVSCVPLYNFISALGGESRILHMATRLFTELGVTARGLLDGREG